MKRIILALSLLLALSSTAIAQTLPRYSIWDWKHRASVTLNSGYLNYKTVDAENPWVGIDLGGSLVYSAHPQLAVYANYLHGFPVLTGDGQTNQARLVADIRVYPGPTALNTGKFRLVMGGGGLWLGRETVKDWRGYEAHITGAFRTPIDRVAVFGTYSHAFATQPELGQKDFDFIRSGLTVRLWQ